MPKPLARIAALLLTFNLIGVDLVSAQEFQSGPAQGRPLQVFRLDTFTAQALSTPVVNMLSGPALPKAVEYENAVATHPVLRKYLYDKVGGIAGYIVLPSLLESSFVVGLDLGLTTLFKIPYENSFNHVLIYSAARLIWMATYRWGSRRWSSGFSETSIFVTSYSIISMAVTFTHHVNPRLELPLIATYSFVSHGLILTAFATKSLAFWLNRLEKPFNSTYRGQQYSPKAAEIAQATKEVLTHLNWESPTQPSFSDKMRFIVRPANPWYLRLGFKINGQRVRRVRAQLPIRALGSKSIVEGRWHTDAEGHVTLSIDTVFLDAAQLPNAHLLNLTNRKIFSRLLQTVGQSHPSTDIIRIEDVAEKKCYYAIDAHIRKSVGYDIRQTEWKNVGKALSIYRYTKFKDEVREILRGTPFGRALIQAGYSDLDLDWAAFEKRGDLHLIGRRPLSAIPSDPATIGMMHKSLAGSLHDVGDWLATHRLMRLGEGIKRIAAFWVAPRLEKSLWSPVEKDLKDILATTFHGTKKLSENVAAAVEALSETIEKGADEFVLRHGPDVHVNGRWVPTAPYAKQLRTVYRDIALQMIETAVTALETTVDPWGTGWESVVQAVWKTNVSAHQAYNRAHYGQHDGHVIAMASQHPRERVTFIRPPNSSIQRLPISLDVRDRLERIAHLIETGQRDDAKTELSRLSDGTDLFNNVAVAAHIHWLLSLENQVERATSLREQMKGWIESLRQTPEQNRKSLNELTLQVSLMLSEILWFTHKNNEAIETLEWANQRVPDYISTPLRTRLAIYLRDTGNLEAALHVLSTDGQTVRATLVHIISMRRALSNIHTEMGHYSLARAVLSMDGGMSFDQKLKGDVQSEVAWADALDREGHHEEAILFIRERPEMEMKSDFVTFALARFLGNAGRPGEGVQLLSDNGETLKPGFKGVHMAELTLAKLFIQRGNVSDAIPLLQNIPAHSYPYYEKAQLLIQQVVHTYSALRPELASMKGVEIDQGDFPGDWARLPSFAIQKRSSQDYQGPPLYRILPSVVVPITSVLAAFCFAWLLLNLFYTHSPGFMIPQPLSLVYTRSILWAGSYSIVASGFLLAMARILKLSGKYKINERPDLACLRVIFWISFPLYVVTIASSASALIPLGIHGVKSFAIVFGTTAALAGVGALWRRPGWHIGSMWKRRVLSSVLLLATVFGWGKLWTIHSAQSFRLQRAV